MNELKSLINTYIKKNQLTRGKLANKLGYQNISSGLRTLDAFIESANDITLQKQLQNILNIPENELKSAVDKQFLNIHKDAMSSFKPYIRINWSRKPSLLMTAQPFEYLYKISIPQAILKLPLDKQLKKICSLYQQHQLKHHGKKFNIKNILNNYDEYVSALQQNLEENGELDWSIGNGFTYYRAFNESYQFNKICKQLPQE